MTRSYDIRRTEFSTDVTIMEGDRPVLRGYWTRRLSDKELLKLRGNPWEMFYPTVPWWRRVWDWLRARTTT